MGPVAPETGGIGRVTIQLQPSVWNLPCNPRTQVIFAGQTRP